MAVIARPVMRSPFLQDRFSTVPLFAYTHLGASAIALMAGPFQLNSRLRGRYLSLHRRLGRLYVICVMLGGVAGFLFATMSEGGFVAHFGFALLAVLWLLTTGAAYLRIRARDEVAHRGWMTRSFALTFAAVTLRIYIPLFLALGVSFETAYPIISWTCWVPNLIVAEWLIPRRRRAVPSIEARSVPVV